MTRITVTPEADGLRLDLFLWRAAADRQTRGEIQRLIRAGSVQITGKRTVKPSTIVHVGQDILLRQELDGQHPVTEPAGLSTAPDTLPTLRILHEDPTLIVLDKPAGVPVHVGVKREPTIADALVVRYPGLKTIGAPTAAAGSPETFREALRAGIVHRLDKNTSGVLLVARTPEMFEHLQRQFQNRRVRKEYRALVHGVVPEAEGVIKLPLARSQRNPLRRTIARPGEGKDAETSFHVLERYLGHTLLAVFPRTGRMHQIRVHLAHLGFPVAGDPLYGKRARSQTPPGLSRLFLHATKLTVRLPSGKEKTFESPLPPNLMAVLAALRARRTTTPKKPVTYRWRTPRTR